MNQQMGAQTGRDPSASLWISDRACLQILYSRTIHILFGCVATFILANFVMYHHFLSSTNYEYRMNENSEKLTRFTTFSRHQPTENVIFTLEMTKPNSSSSQQPLENLIPTVEMTKRIRFSSQQPPENLTLTLEVTKHLEHSDYTLEKLPLRITINQQGRLGNRLFKYASLLGIANATGRQALVGPSVAYLRKMRGVFCLSHVVKKLPSDIKSWTVVSETMYSKFDPVFRNLPSHDIMIDGYVQSWKYFANIQDEIRREFRFRRNIEEKVAKIRDKVSHKYPGQRNLVFIGVHVRRPDTDNSNTTVAPKSFFLNAFQKMKSLLPGKNVVFVVVGNDLNWCHTNLQGSGVVILDPAPAEIHFAVLASCDHVIVSCGTYGWWAAWLANGHVVFYRKFPDPNSYEFNGFVYEDYYPPHWIPV